MKKRVLTLILAVLFVLSCAMLASCGGSESGQTTTPADQSTPTKGGEEQSTTPGAQPSTTPDVQPSTTPAESSTPVAPTEDPTVAPTDDPTVAPTEDPTVAPTEDPTVAPTSETPVAPTTTPAAEIPPVNTPEWAQWLSDNGSDDEEYGYLEMLQSEFYNADFDGDGSEYTGCPWENWGEPKHFEFLIQFPVDEFEINFNDATETSPYTWHIWYKDADTDEPFKECVTKPWSLYYWGETKPGWYIFRVPTYLGGMTDLHTDDGEPNQYEFIIAIFDDEDDSLVCWANVFPDVTNSYEAFLEEALDNDYKLGWND